MRMRQTAVSNRLERMRMRQTAVRNSSYTQVRRGKVAASLNSSPSPNAQPAGIIKGSISVTCFRVQETLTIPLMGMQVPGRNESGFSF